MGRRLQRQRQKQRQDPLLCVWQSSTPRPLIYRFLALNRVIVKERIVGESQRQLTYISILMSLFFTILNCCNTLVK